MKQLAYCSHAKLLITAEYLVLDGALALALPLKFGQCIRVEETSHDMLLWEAREQGKPWFEAAFSMPGMEIISTSDEKTAAFLAQLLGAACRLNPGFRARLKACSVITDLDYPRKWGLGSSSTLIYNTAAWAGTDPYALHRAVSKGSGYDIACASADGPILYKLDNGRPVVQAVGFSPPFAENLYFVYLGNKMDSALSVSKYRNRGLEVQQKAVREVGSLTKVILEAKTLAVFNEAVKRHEEVVSEVTGLTPLRKSIFSDFRGQSKSLGAWGGDFALLTWEFGRDELMHYLAAKSLDLVFGFDDIVLSRDNRT